MQGQQSQLDEQPAALGDDRRQRQSLTLATERELQSPLRALRVLLEGRRGSQTSLNERTFIDRAFVDRALKELLRAERAAADLVQWATPREIRAVPCAVSEIVDSLANRLDRDERERCHFVVEDGDTRLVTDGRLVVDSFARTIQALLGASMNAASEIMIHAHVEDDWATFSLVEGDTESGDEADLDAPQSSPNLAESLFERDLSRLGGRVSLHCAGGHRCCVVVLPLSDQAATQEPAPMDTEARAFGGAA